MNTKLKISILSLATFALVAAAPAVSFAHEDSLIKTDLSVKASVKADKKAGDRKDMKNFARRILEGTVTSVGTNGSLTVEKTNGTQATVQTSSSTTVKKDGKPAVMADVTAGTMIAAKGTWDSASSVFTASKIAIVKKLHPIRNWMANLFAQHVVNGSITAISGSTLTVQSENGTSYTVNTSSAKFLAKSQTAASLSEVKVGDKVHIFGNISGTSVTAEIVHDISLSK